MSPFKKLLAPIDFSPHSDEALRVACQLAETFDAPLTLVHVFAAPVYPTPDGSVVAFPSSYAELVQAANTQVEKVVAAIKRDHNAVRVDGRTLEGVAFREIIGFARKSDTDLIVLGTHGRTGIKHVLLGSVAERVVRKAPCAVLTVRLPGHSFEHP
ncbi:MAG TPA: universal stress protein [Kofleriaceae bacterium]|nr:universal stress protein [Kofleriaceae bacterium]